MNNSKRMRGTVLPYLLAAGMVLGSDRGGPSVRISIREHEDRKMCRLWACLGLQLRRFSTEKAN